MYDFDRTPDRRPWDSVKWSYLGRDCPSGEREVIPLWVADMDFAAPPELAAAMAERAGHAVYGYSGLPDRFFEAFATWMRARHDVAVERKHMVFSPGVVPGLALAVRAFTEAGDGVLIQPPVYHPFPQVVLRAGRRVIENRLVLRDGRYVIDFEDLEKKIRSARMMILCSPHNPVGRVWTEEELERIAELAARRQVVLVSDEIHSDIVYPPVRHTSALALELADRSLLAVFHAPSKTFNIAGLQTSVAVIPGDELRRRFEAEAAAIGLNIPNVFGGRAAETAWKSCGPWLDELLAYLEGNWRYLRDRVAAQMPALEVMPIEGSYLAWVDFRRSGIEEAAKPGVLHDFLVRRARIWCDEGSKFGAGGEGFVRINFACPRALLAEALDRLRDALPPAALS